MRTIKFRAVYEGKIYQVAGINFGGGYTGYGKTVTLIGKKTIFSVDLSKVVLLQFTGLLDKNGKEIYEGDVIVNGDGVWLEIYWNQEVCAFYQRTCNRENVIERGWEWNEKENTNMDLRFNLKEVIGNIYENPELLKQ